MMGLEMKRLIMFFILFIQNDISLFLFVIPGLTRNPVFSWIPAFAGMTCFAAINDAAYRFALPLFQYSTIPIIQ